jgi:hypothetical protein
MKSYEVRFDLSHRVYQETFSRVMPPSAGSCHRALNIPEPPASTVLKGGWLTINALRAATV